LIYSEIDGKSGDGGALCVVRQQRNVPHALDCRHATCGLCRAIQRVAGAQTTRAPMVAVATTSTNVAAEADRQRIAQAQAAARVATQTAASTQAARPDAETLAQVELDGTDWIAAERAGNVAGYQSYLAAHPTGAQAAAARAAIAKLNKPAPFSLDLVSGDVKAAAEAARRAQSVANTRAAAARDAASAASGAAGVRSIVAADGDQYEAQISAAPNGLDTRSARLDNTGDRYRGELRNGRSGVGVYELRTTSTMLVVRCVEGEHAADSVWLWRYVLEEWRQFRPPGNGRERAVAGCADVRERTAL
jgi:hypothetical protein